MTRKSLPFRGIVYALLAVGGAILVGLLTAVTSNQLRFPAVSVGIGMGPQGQALARLAYRHIELATVKRPNAPVEQLVTPKDVAMARTAFSKEPLSIGALALIAMGDEKAGRTKEARQLYQASTRLSRRSPLVIAWLVRDAARRNDEKAVFQNLSRLIRTAPETQAIYIPALAQGLERQSSVEPMVSLLGTGPSWKDSFWREVAARPNSHKYGAMLREKIIAAPWRQRQIGQTDRELLAAMVVSGHLDEAAILAARLEGRTGSTTAKGSPIVNGNFSKRVVLTPFDWQLFSDGDFGADIDEKASALSVSALPGVSGTVARQLIAVPSGRYRFSWRAVDGAATGSGGLRARMICAERGKQIALAPVALEKGRGARDIAVPDSCRWYWLNLEIAPSVDGQGLDVALDAIDLQRVSQTAK